MGRGWKQNIRTKVQKVGPAELAENFHLSYLDRESCGSTIAHTVALAVRTVLHDLADASSSFAPWNPGCSLVTAGTLPTKSLGTGYASACHSLLPEILLAHISPFQRSLPLLPLNPAT